MSSLSLPTDSAFPQVRLVKPLSSRFVMLAAEVDSRPSLLPASGAKRALLKLCKQHCARLGAVPGVKSANVFRALLTPPGRGAYLHRRPQILRSGIARIRKWRAGCRDRRTRLSSHVGRSFVDQPPLLRDRSHKCTPNRICRPFTRRHLSFQLFRGCGPGAQPCCVEPHGRMVPEGNRARQFNGVATRCR